MGDRVILHCDLNNFFASVETYYRPELKDVPIAVCGSKEERHGIVLAKNDLAKGFGVITAEAIWQAQKKCPDLVIVPPHYDWYMDFSKRAREIYKQYTDLVEPFGIDECWLDVTNSTKLFGSGEQIANIIKERIKQELGVCISVGVSFNKIFAKLGSDLKKPDAVTVLSKDTFKDKIFNLKAEEILGVGKKTRVKLNSIGIYTIGEIANCNPKILEKLLGKLGVQLFKNCNGLDFSPVLNYEQLPSAKSYSRSMTCKNDLVNIDQVSMMLIFLTEKVASSLRKDQKLATNVQICIRDTDLVTKEFSQKLQQASRIVDVIFSTGMNLFLNNWNFEKNVRSIGIRASDIVDEDSNIQYNLFYNDEKYEKKEKLETKVFEIRNKFGKNAVVRAAVMNLDVRDKDTPVFKNINQVK